MQQLRQLDADIASSIESFVNTRIATSIRRGANSLQVLGGAIGFS